MGREKPKVKSKSQKEIFIELSKEEKIIVDILNEKETVHIDEINLQKWIKQQCYCCGYFEFGIAKCSERIAGENL